MDGADRPGEKFEGYRTIASLQEYAILSQDEVRLELFRRRSGWEREVFGPDDAVTFESVDLTVKVAALYRRTGLHDRNESAAAQGTAANDLN